jgi:HlyD family secretion protein
MRNAATLILIIFIFMTGISCAPKKKEEKVVEKVPVTVVQPQTRDIMVYYSTSASIQADDVQTIAFSVAGKIEKIYKDEGEYIQAGEPLASLDRTMYADGLTAATSNLDLAKKSNNAANIEKQIYVNELQSAKDELDDMEKEYDRAKRLYAEQAMTKKELEERELDYKDSKIRYENAEKMVKLSDGKIATTLDGIKAAEAQQGMAQKQYNDAVLAAPFSGTIKMKFIEEGAVVSPGIPVFEVVASSLMRIETSLPERYINSIEDGSNVLVTIPNNDCKMSPQKITRVYRDIDSNTGTFGVTIDLADSGKCVRHGMFAHLDFEVDRKNQVLSIPIECVIDLSGEKIVYVNRDNKAMKTVVTTGISSSEFIEIISGLTPEDNVILSGNRYVVNDTPVNVLQPEQDETSTIEK